MYQLVENVGQVARNKTELEEFELLDGFEIQIARLQFK